MSLLLLASGFHRHFTADDFLHYLYRVQGSPFSDIITHAPHVNSAWMTVVTPQPADKYLVLSSSMGDSSYLCLWIGIIDQYQPWRVFHGFTHFVNADVPGCFQVHGLGDTPDKWQVGVRNIRIQENPTPSPAEAAPEKSTGEIVPEGAKVEKLADGFKFTEGPAQGPDGKIYFTDIPNERIMVFDPASGKTEVFRENSGRANGLWWTPADAMLACEGGKPVWRHIDVAKLTMRDFSDAFLDGYLEAEWPAIGGCAGGYRLEGRGGQLFTQLDGSYFTILGLPLLPLLDYLRVRGVMEK